MTAVIFAAKSFPGCAGHNSVAVPCARIRVVFRHRGSNEEVGVAVGSIYVRLFALVRCAMIAQTTDAPNGARRPCGNGARSRNEPLRRLNCGT